MNAQVLNSLNSITSDAWNRLCTENNPFLKYEFLSALEHNQCLQPFGWEPQYITAHDAQNRLLGVIPMYLKTNSYGELVFDWAWAEAYQRAGMPYYPKLVVAIPYTPVTSQRILMREDCDQKAVSKLLTNTAIQHAKALNVSSLHWLFPTDQEAEKLKTLGLMRRMGCQYHWHNHSLKKKYTDFADFLSTLSSSKRKKIKRERRQVEEAGIKIKIVPGDQASDEQLQAAERFYRITFDDKWGTATLNLSFFQEIARTMGKQLILIFALHEGQYVACAIFFKGNRTLYGRHWGCDKIFHSLHFELCYYQSIEYCINEGLEHFDPGAQGEHKISRGFLPTPTYSAHWIADDKFRVAIQDFLDRETEGVQNYMDEISEHSPYVKGR